jgi:hypothetical protein
MYSVILQIAVFASLGFIVYLIARGAMRTSQQVLQQTEAKLNSFDQFVAKLPLKKIDDFINLVLGKTLRRLKLMVMKVDNLLNRQISKLKKNGGGDKIGNGD